MEYLRNFNQCLSNKFMLYPEKISRAETFDELIDISARIIKESNPTLSTSLGIVIYNNLWPDNSIHGVNQDIETLVSIKDKLDEFSHLSDSDDYQLLDWYLTVNLHELRELRWWESAHTVSSLVLGGILSLVRKTHPSQTSRVESIIARLRSISPLIKGDQRRISHPVQRWIDAEIKGIHGLVLYLENLPDLFEDDEDEELIVELNQSIEYASNELNKHLVWLDELEGSKNIPTKPDAFRKLLKLRKIGYSVEELEELGWYYLEETQNELEELTTKLGGESVDQVRNEIRSDHAPNFEAVIENYKELANKARQFLIENEIVTLPEEQLKVVKTPDPWKSFLSIAAAGMPSRFDKDQTGYFYCTVHKDETMLEEHSYAYQPLLICHESYPGHHLHGAAKNTHPSLVRTRIFSNPSATTGLMYSSKLADITEGWGLYTEEMMWKAGFENDPSDPDLRQRFLQVNAMRWRATRIVIDTQLHTGRMTFDEAVEFLIEKTGYHRTTATAELMMYSRSPGYFSSYLLGKHQLKLLREKVGDKLTDKEFHDAIIYAGDVPYWFIEEKILEKIS